MLLNHCYQIVMCPGTMFDHDDQPTLRTQPELSELHVHSLHWVVGQ